MNKDDIVFYFICFGFLFMITAFLSVRGLTPLCINTTITIEITRSKLIPNDKGINPRTDKKAVIIKRKPKQIK